MKKTDKKTIKKTMSEFKEFISRGNVIDLAVGIIIGSAFTAIVNSIVNDIIMPITSFIIGGLHFNDLKFVLKGATDTTSEVAILYGNFIQKTIDFLIIAMVVFIIIKQINKIRNKLEDIQKAKEKKDKEKQEVEALVAEVKNEPVVTETELLTQIRDLLQEKVHK